MYLTRGKWPSQNRKVYKTAYLRQSYREGRQVKTRIVANLTRCSEAELDAIELALKHKGNLAVLGSVENVELVEGRSVGAVRKKIFDMGLRKYNVGPKAKKVKNRSRRRARPRRR